MERPKHGTHRDALSIADARRRGVPGSNAVKIGRLFRRPRWRTIAHALYVAIVLQARRPEFYVRCAVPDTADGRFDAIALHAFLVLRRLKQDHARTAQLAQALFDLMFEDMDQNLREMGVGDLGVGRRVKAMAEAFYGRAAAYETASGGDDAALGEALRRNLYRGAAPSATNVAAMVAYMRRETAVLDTLDVARLIEGNLSFGAPPGANPEGDGATDGIAS